MEYFAKLVERNDEKIFQTLYGHSFDALVALNNWILNNESALASFCSRWGIALKSFKQSIVWSVALHDMGKAIPPFQKNIRQGKHSSRYPHPFFSLPVLLAAFQDDLIKPLLPKYTPKIQYPLIEILSVMGHHSQLYNGLYSNTHASAVIDTEALKIVEKILEGTEKLDLSLKGRVDSVSKLKIRDLISDLFKRDVSNVRSMSEKVKLKSIYSFFFSLLKQSDISASASFRDFVSATKSDKKIFDSVLEISQKGKDGQFDFSKIDEKLILNDNSSYPFQRALTEDLNPYTMLLAPCGRGKTEGALLWATKLCKLGLNRIVFALPTQVTSNAMQNRLRTIFGEENVGLYHGRSSVKLREEKLGDDQDPDSERKLKILEEIRDENFRSNVYWQPVVITTVDHLLYSFVHGFPQADFALGNLQTSVIIFDEIHCYDKKLLSHLKQLFRLLRQMGIPHLLMSGTFPEFLMDEIRNDFAKNGEYKLVLDDDGLKFQPFQIIKRNGTLVRTRDEEGNKAVDVSNEFIDSVLKGYSNGLRQFVILNTVFRAQTVYQELKKALGGENDDLMLFHSQFTYRDRREKEKYLTGDKEKRPFILVATQVIEISLNISSDIMYTEIAPMDALGQRAGRLNRGNPHFQNNGHTYRLIIFEAENHYPYVEKKELLPTTWNELKDDSYSYGAIRNICNKIYADAELGDSNFLSIFRECTLFGYSHRDIRWSKEEGKRFKPRDNSFMKIDVIPYQFYEQLGDDALKAEYFASVPLWWYTTDLENKLGNFMTHEKKRKKYLLTRIPYTKEIGFDRAKVMEMNFDEGSNIL